MKKRLLLTLMLLLCLAVLWGCGEKAQADPVTLYYNLDKGVPPTADANGSYTFHFAVEGSKKSYTVSDKALAEQLQYLDFVGLTLEGDTVTGITRMSDLPYSRMAWNYYVQSIGGNTVKLNTVSTFAGKELVLKLTEDLSVYDITPHCAEFGAKTQLQKNDCVSVIADENGEAMFAYVTDRPAKVHDGQLFCQHCQSQVTWYDWTSTTALPLSSGHYLLTSDVTLTRDTKLGAVDICLDLGGKTVTQSAYGTRIFAMESGGTLSIMDSVGGGSFIPSSTEEQNRYARYGMIVLVNHYESTLNLYSGTLDASSCTAQTACAISVQDGTFNMYGGTILGGTVYGTGSSAVSANGTVNIYDGRIVGGKHISTDYTPLNPPGGATMRVLGTTTIYGGIIEGGESYCEGGALRLTSDATESGNVKLILKGGTITAGKATLGEAIYAKTGVSIEISGNVKITGGANSNLYLEPGVELIVGEEGLGEEAQIGISMDGRGQFISQVPEGTDISGHFTSDDPGKRIVSTGNGTWSLK